MSAVILEAGCVEAWQARFDRVKAERDMLKAALEEIAVASVHQWDNEQEAEKDIHSAAFWERKLRAAMEVSWDALRKLSGPQT